MASQAFYEIKFTYFIMHKYSLNHRWYQVLGILGSRAIGIFACRHASTTRAYCCESRRYASRIGLFADRDVLSARLYQQIRPFGRPLCARSLKRRAAARLYTTCAHTRASTILLHLTYSNTILHFTFIEGIDNRYGVISWKWTLFTVSLEI